MNIDQHMARIAVANHLTKRLRATQAEDKDAILKEIPAGERRKAIIDGHEVGTITTTQPKTTEKITVTDPVAYAEWLMECDKLDMIHLMPTEWACGETVIRGLIDDGGEIPDGVTITETTGRPTVQVRISDAQATAIDELMATQGMRLIEQETTDDQ